MATLIAISTGSLAAASLSELRAEHNHRGDRQHIVQKRHKKVHAVRERRHAARSRISSRKISHAKKVQRRIDRKLHRKYAKHRSFRTAREFRRLHRHVTERRGKKAFSREDRNYGRRDRISSRYHRWNKDRYRGRHSERYGYYDQWKPRHTKRGYRHTRRAWYLAYLYERAPFYDRQGYKYGYFSRRGFMFEGEFYRYDRYYTYRDRLRGRGLFDRWYYRPAYSQFGDFFAALGGGGSYFYAELDF